MQEIAWYTTLVVVAIIAAVFIRVALLSQTKLAAPSGAGRVRAGVFWLLTIVGVVVAVATLRALPYSAPAAAGEPQMVNVTGYQWYWDIDQENLVAGQPIQFNVTSADVNHGFGIYDEDTRLLAEVQAMPGYINSLHFTFEKPGTYRIMCLEYCGAAHHDMVEQIEVTAP